MPAIDRYLAAACQTDFPNPRSRDEIAQRVGHMLAMIDRAVVGYRPFGDVKLLVFPEFSHAAPIYEKAEERVPIVSFKVAADLPEADRPRVEILRTDTPAFERVVQLRRTRRDAWFHFPVEKIEVCNGLVPSRPVPAK